MTYGTATSTLPNAYFNDATLASFGDSLSYVSGSLEIVTAAVPSVWATAQGGSWNANSNWVNNSIPNGDGALAGSLRRPAATPYTITLDAPQTVGQLVLSFRRHERRLHDRRHRQQHVDVQQHHCRNFAEISVIDGQHEIDAQVVLASNLVVTSTTSNPCS